MKYLFCIILLLSPVLLFSQNGRVSPLASYSAEWNAVKYSKCNTAVNADYMSSSEKDVIYILNLIRSNPALFAKTVLKKYPAVSGNDQLTDNIFYFKSLFDTLLKLESKKLLYPDTSCFASAQCHAYNSGIKGYVGHERKTKGCRAVKYYDGECCDYGHKDPLDIVLALLIDEGVPSLGHRTICLSNYTKIAVSIQPHSKYLDNAVLDFSY